MARQQHSIMSPIKLDLKIQAKQIMFALLKPTEMIAIQLMIQGKEMTDEVTKAQLVNVIYILCQRLGWIEDEMGSISDFAPETEDIKISVDIPIKTEVDSEHFDGEDSLQGEGDKWQIKNDHPYDRVHSGSTGQESDQPTIKILKLDPSASPENVDPDDVKIEQIEEQLSEGVQNTQDLQHSCSNCDKKFTTAYDLTRHQIMHSDERPFSCSICYKRFKRADALRQHEKLDCVKDIRHICPVCDKKFISGTSWAKHIQSCSLSCTKCDKTFKNNDNYKNHIKHHCSKEKFVCTTCGKSFSFLESLKTHESTVHSGEVSCPKCDKKLRSIESLKIHEKKGCKHREMGTLLNCSECPYTTDKKSNLVQHQRHKHSNEEPYGCSFCGRMFKSRGQLTKHEMTHSGEKPHQCSQCGQKFLRADYLRNHERTHGDVKPFVCGTCGKKFKRPDALRKHERLHTGVKPFSCSKCEKIFGRKDNKNTHEKTCKASTYQ